MHEEQPGNTQYRRAVQPRQILIPVKLTNGKEQMISVPEIRDLIAGPHPPENQNTFTLNARKKTNKDPGEKTPVKNISR